MSTSCYISDLRAFHVQIGARGTDPANNLLVLAADTAAARAVINEVLAPADAKATAVTEGNDNLAFFLKQGRIGCLARQTEDGRIKEMSLTSPRAIRFAQKVLELAKN
ncbi:MAG: hypothetical protein PHW63_09900 [Alphaproteobacteria bacterium]|nr:hypothetical protein [Alphaproteobacteria bacterium]